MPGRLIQPHEHIQPGGLLRPVVPLPGVPALPVGLTRPDVLAQYVLIQLFYQLRPFALRPVWLLLQSGLPLPGVPILPVGPILPDVLPRSPLAGEQFLPVVLLPVDEPILPGVRLLPAGLLPDEIILLVCRLRPSVQLPGVLLLLCGLPRPVAPLQSG